MAGGVHNRHTVPPEVFASISEEIMGQTNFGHQFSKTNSQIIYNITDFQKAKYLFSRMGIVELWWIGTIF